MNESEKLLAQLFHHVIEDFPPEYMTKHLGECLDEVVMYFKKNERIH